MSRFTILPAFVAAIALAIPAQSSVAQSSPRILPQSLPGKSRPVKRTLDEQALDFWSPLDDQPIVFYSPSQMSRQDRRLEAGAESSIAAQAAQAAMDFSQGKWSYDQIACPALPNHLFLRFMRNQGAGDVSAFSVAIARQAAGQVHIFPILRRSDSLYMPAAVNPLTVAKFNRILSEEHPAEPTAWLGLSLCYAALAGADPQVHFHPTDQDFEKPGAAPVVSNLVGVDDRGDVTVQFADAAAAAGPNLWKLTFDREGKLLHVERSSTPTYRVQILPASQSKSAAAAAKP